VKFCMSFDILCTHDGIQGRCNNGRRRLCVNRWASKGHDHSRWREHLSSGSGTVPLQTPKDCRCTGCDRRHMCRPTCHYIRYLITPMNPGTFKMQGSEPDKKLIKKFMCSAHCTVLFSCSNHLCSMGHNQCWHGKKWGQQFSSTACRTWRKRGTITRDRVEWRHDKWSVGYVVLGETRCKSSK